eukprot:COSAG01_NODE_218_length_21548_cov_7.916919_12_plen_100_part_00
MKPESTFFFYTFQQTTDSPSPAASFCSGRVRRRRRVSRLLGHDRPGKPKGYCTAAHLLCHGAPAAAAAGLCCCGVAIILPAAAAATPRGTREQDTHLAS